MTDLRGLPRAAELPSPLLLTNACGDLARLGPIFATGEGVCADCAGRCFRTAGQGQPAPPDASQTAMAALKSAAARLAEDFRNGTAGEEWFRTVLEFDVTTGSRRRHALVPSADCPNCGHLRLYVPATAHCDPLTGILRDVTVTGEPVAGSYSAMGSYVAPLAVNNARPGLKDQLVLGKGSTRQQAIDSCIGEALERYSLIYRGDEPLVRARMRELPAVDPREILLLSERQYEQRDAWNRGHDGRYWIPERFDDQALADWLPGTDLSTGEAVYVPAACCLMWYQFPEGEARFASADTIGCAAGSDMAAATAGALLEAIERDALAIWWYTRARRPAIAPQQFGCEALDRIACALRAAHRELYLIDIATDVNIPTYAAVSPAADGSEPLFASAAHPSAREAALKAASEVAQLIFLTIQAGGLERDLHAWVQSATLSSQTYLVPQRWCTPLSEPGPLTSQQVIQRCIEALQAVRLRAIAVDQSRADVLAKTVRVVVPGLRHIWARFGPGRLYEVPVRLGWVSRPTGESGLNSILCMI